MNPILTAGADRKAIFQTLDELISVHKSSNKKLAVLLLNLNNFRHLNTIYGHVLGDSILQEFLSRLKRVAREQDYVTRIGNADFIMILPEVFNQGHAKLAALKITEVLSDAFELGSHKFNITADIGISFYPEHSEKTEGVLQKAEVALSDARSSIASYAIFTESSDATDLNRWDIAADLQGAQGRDEFDLFFQPQVCLQTGALLGAEALIRWNRPEYGFVPPDIFMPITEQSGQIHEITQWTVNTALRLIKDWPHQNVPLKVAINLSAKVLEDPTLVDSIKSAMGIWNADFKNIILEVTESALINDMVTSLDTLHKLKELGVTISIDDFGTGYSSMAYFKKIPAKELKIDKSFILNMLENNMDRHIVESVIKMAHGFDIKVVAEGVENKDTYQLLKRLGCDIAQGYYLAKPMPQKAFIQWVNDYNEELIFGSR